MGKAWQRAFLAIAALVFFSGMNVDAAKPKKGKKKGAASTAASAKKTPAKKTASAPEKKAAPAAAQKATETNSAATEEKAPAKVDDNSERAPVSKGGSLEANRSAEFGDLRHFRYKFNTGPGIDLVSGLGSGFHVAGQFGYSPWEGRPFYVGPSVGFTLFSPGSIITTDATAWYELRIYGAPRLSLTLGIGLGAAITSSTPQFSSFTYHGFLEGCIVQQISELASVRGQLRPSVIGGYFGFNVNLDVQFRFL